MAIVTKQVGDDLIFEAVDRSFGGERKEVMKLDGTTGELTISTGLVLPDGVGIDAPLSVDTGDIANAAVTSAKLAANAVTTAKITDANVTTAKIADLNVTTAKIDDLGVTTGKINALAVTTAKLAAASVTAAKALAFVSTEQTGTGSSQNVAHGLGATPSLVLVVPTAGHNGSGSAGTQMPTITEGAHGSTNVVVTVSSAAKFKILAWA